MSALPGFELRQHTPHMALSMVDRLAQVLGAGGAFPPVLGDVSCAVIGATSPVQRTFVPPRVLNTFRNRSGYLLLDGTYVDPVDSSRHWPLGQGRYKVRVRGEFYQDAEFTLDWPPADGECRIRIAPKGDSGSVELLPSAAYPLADVTMDRLQLGPTILRGSAFAADGAPLAGLLAEVIDLPFPQPPLLRPKLVPLDDWPFLRAVSGSSGDWVLILPPRRCFDTTEEIPPLRTLPLKKDISVRVNYPGGAVTTVQKVLLGSEHSVRNMALRGQVLGPGGRPIAGARITTSAAAGSSVTRADGLWTLYFDLNQTGAANISVTATPAGHAPKTDTTATLRPGSTVFVPTFYFP